MDMNSQTKNFLQDTTLVLLALVACAVIVLAGASVAVADGPKKYEVRIIADSEIVRSSGWHGT